MAERIRHLATNQDDGGSSPSASSITLYELESKDIPWWNGRTLKELQEIADRFNGISDWRWIFRGVGCIE